MPVDEQHFPRLSGRRQILVHQKEVRLSAPPLSVSYGTVVRDADIVVTQEDGQVDAVAGEYFFRLSSLHSLGEVLPAGTYEIQIEFHPSDRRNYCESFSTSQLSVRPREPLLSWTTPKPVEFGTALSEEQLCAVCSETEGTLTYSHQLGEVLGAGERTLSVRFEPLDRHNLLPAQATVLLSVRRRALTLTWPEPAQMSFGERLSDLQLNARLPEQQGEGGQGVQGHFLYDPPLGTLLPVGQTELAVSFQPSDSDNYLPCEARVTVSVRPAVPQLDWTAGPPIQYGRAIPRPNLSASHLGDPLAGTWKFRPDLSEILEVIFSFIDFDGN